MDINIIFYSILALGFFLSFIITRGFREQRILSVNDEMVNILNTYVKMAQEELIDHERIVIKYKDLSAEIKLSSKCSHKSSDDTLVIKLTTED